MALPLYKPGQVIRPQSPQAFHFRQKGGFFLVVFLVGIYCSVRNRLQCSWLLWKREMPFTPLLTTLGSCLIRLLTWEPKQKGTLHPPEFSRSLRGSGTKPGKAILRKWTSKTQELSQPQTLYPKPVLPQLRQTNSCLTQISVTSMSHYLKHEFSKSGSNLNWLWRYKREEASSILQLYLLSKYSKSPT